MYPSGRDDCKRRNPGKVAGRGTDLRREGLETYRSGDELTVKEVLRVDYWTYL